MGRRKLGTSSPPMNVISRFEEATKSSSLITQMDSRLGQYASQFLSKLWLPFCFAGINAVCYAIEPSTGVLMMMSSTFLLHQMGVAGRGLTAFVIGLALAALLWHGSDVVYILAVHTLYYCAVSMVSCFSCMAVIFVSQWHHQPLYYSYLQYHLSQHHTLFLCSFFST